MTITDRTKEYAENLKEKLQAKGIRVETDYRNEKIGYKIREAQMSKVPYMVVLGDKEVEENVLAVRSRAEGDLGKMTQEEFIDKLVEEIEKKIIKNVDKK